MDTKLHNNTSGERMATNITCYQHFSELIKPGDISTSLYAVLVASNGVSALPAVVVNSLIILTIYKTPALKSVPSMILIANIALSDLVVGLIAQPIFVTWMTLEYNHGDANFLCGVCILFSVFSTLFAGVSLFSMTISSIDRYLALRLHLRYPTIVTSRRLLILCGVCWVGVLAGSLSWIPFGYDFYNYGAIACLLTCLSATSICYGVIFTTVRKHKRQICKQGVVSTDNNTDSETVSYFKEFIKSVVTAVFIYGVFICCYMPHLVVSLVIAVIGFNRSSLLGLKISSTIIFINSSINPFVFLYRVTDLREAFRRVVSKLYLKNPTF